MRILICGDRNYNSVESVFNYMSGLPADTVIIEGECKGADIIAKHVALRLGLQLIPFPADWDQGHKGGPIRNRQMLVEGRPDRVVAFHDSLSTSRGTRNMIMQTLKAGIPITHHRSNGTSRSITSISDLNSD